PRNSGCYRRPHGRRSPNNHRRYPFPVECPTGLQGVSYASGMTALRRTGIVLLYLAALAGGSYLAFRPTFDSDFARVPGDPGDTMLNHYLLEHTRRAMFDPTYRGTILSPPFFHPTPLVLGYSENLLGVAPLYWGLRTLLPEVPAFQVWLILLNGLNLIAFAAAARWLGAGPVAALLGGYLWAFGLVHIDQVKHAQL